MIKEYFEVGDDKWGIILCCDYNILDYDEIWAICRSFGLSDKKSNEAIRVLSSPNSGMTISNFDICMSVVFISDATSQSQWWSTLNHELTHVGTAIIDYYGEPYDEEPAAYLQGELMRLVVDRISEPCR